MTVCARKVALGGRCPDPEMLITVESSGVVRSETSAAADARPPICHDSSLLPSRHRTSEDAQLLRRRRSALAVPPSAIVLEPRD